tara:strand:- start:851 stop:1120 length:270 start_codon:yes stop_codon:yes gene_type:complete
MQIPHPSSFEASTLYDANFHHLAVKMKIWLRSEDSLSGTTNKEDAQEHLGFFQTTKSVQNKCKIIKINPCTRIDKTQPKTATLFQAITP